MLFSNDAVATLINENFEATWQSVRPVPIVTIDFGSGHVLHRTLNGNIATYVCSADGKMLDVLPGVYEPKTFLDRLDQFAKLHQWFQESGPDAVKGVADYHRRQAEVLARGEAPLVFRRMTFLSKARIENPLKLVLAPVPENESKSAAQPTQAESNEVPALGLSSPEDLANWKLLAEDTTINETFRRRMIHEYLAGQVLAADAGRPELPEPAAITKWLYREVLDADIDDPYLGLGKVLFASYPFDDHH